MTNHPAHIVAGNVATAVIAPVVCWMCLNEESNPAHDPAAHNDCPSWCAHHSFERAPASRDAVLTHVGALLAAIRSRDADLLRLCGPACDHGPCKGARAVEHTLKEFSTCVCGWSKADHRPNPASIGNYAGCSFSPVHQPAPTIEAWLREHPK